MRNLILFTLSTVTLLIYPLSLSSQNSFTMSLDMNTASGDQAVTSLNVSASQDVAIQLFGNGMQNARGVSARIEYDASQVTYQRFDAGSVLSSEQVLVEHGTNPTSVQISVVSFSGSATATSGLVGTIHFRTVGTFSGTSIRLVHGELGQGGQVESVMLNVSVALQSGSTSASWDFDGNGRVSFSDFVLFAYQFGSSQGDGTYEAKYDLDSNGSIGFSDFMLFANNFGKQVFTPNSGGNTPKMYWTDFGTDKIQRANLDGSSVEDLITTGLTDPVGIALDVSGGKIYWTDNGTDKIQRANLDGSSVEDLITTGLTGPVGITLDVSEGKIYWIDNGTDKIQRANLDGSSVEDLITTGLSTPRSITLDVSGGKIYWTDNGTDKIQRANLDGSSVEDLITTGLTGPVGIALDVSGGKIYWTDNGTDKIQRANLDGSSVEDLITTGLTGPAGIALDVSGGKIYWIDNGTDKIQRANLDGSSVEDLITTGLSTPRNLVLYLPKPDLIVESPSVSNSSPNAGQSFTLSATVRNQGTVASASTALRYYRSTDETISTDDTQVGTDAVSSLSASSTSDQSISLTAPSTSGTYYYGACVESVSGESNANNNCSDEVEVRVSGTSQFSQPTLSVSASNRSATATWSGDSSASESQLQYRVKDATSWTDATDNTSPSTITGLSGGGVYEFQVRYTASGGTQASDWSATIEATPTGAPNVPSGLSLSQEGITIRATCNAVPAGTNIKYEFRWDNDANLDDGEDDNSPDQTTPSYTITGYSNNQDGALLTETYYVQVRAKNGSTASAWSSSITIAFVVDTTPDSFSLTFTSSSSNTVTITGINTTATVNVSFVSDTLFRIVFLKNGNNALDLVSFEGSSSGSFTIENNDTLQLLRFSTSATFTLTLTIGNLVVQIPEIPDTTPDSFDFTGKFRDSGTSLDSSTITISGINATASGTISFSGTASNGGILLIRDIAPDGNGTIIDLNGDTTGNGIRSDQTGNFTVEDGDTLTIFWLYNDQPYNITATVTIGGVSDTWSVSN